MADNLDQTGVIQVDGAWVTSVKYSAEALGPDTGSIDLRFLQGRAEVGRIAIPRERLSELLGEENRSAIERHIANDADKYLAVVAGELRGRQLHYQKVAWQTPNRIPPRIRLAQRRAASAAPARRMAEFAKRRSTRTSPHRIRMSPTLKPPRPEKRSPPPQRRLACPRT